MPKILHAADLHIDSPLRGLPDSPASTGEDGRTLRTEARSATRRAFSNLITLALDEAVSVLLLAGDIFDGRWEDHHTGVFFARELRRFTDAGGRVFLARGNHDAASKMSHHVALPEGVHTFPTGAPEVVDLPELGLAVHGWSFPTEAVRDDPSTRFPAPIPGRFNIGVLHTNLGGHAGHGNYAPTTVGGLTAKGYDYWALGHIHQRTVVREPACTIVYPGNLQGRHARELAGPEGKGATLLTVEDGRLVHLEHRPVDVLRWHRVEADVTDCATLDDCVRALSGQLAEALSAADVPVALRVVLSGRTAAHGALLAQGGDLRGSILGVLPTRTPVYLEKVKVRTTPPAVVGTDPLAEHVDHVLTEAKAGSREPLRARLLEDLRGILGRSADPDAIAYAESLVTDDKLDVLLDQAAATLLHRLRG